MSKFDNGRYSRLQFLRAAGHSVSHAGVFQVVDNNSSDTADDDGDCGPSVSTRSLFGPPFSGPAFQSTGGQLSWPAVLESDSKREICIGSADSHCLSAVVLMPFYKLHVLEKLWLLCDVQKTFFAPWQFH